MSNCRALQACSSWGGRRRAGTRTAAPKAGAGLAAPKAGAGLAGAPKIPVAVVEPNREGAAAAGAPKGFAGEVAAPKAGREAAAPNAAGAPKAAATTPRAHAARSVDRERYA